MIHPAAMFVLCITSDRTALASFWPGEEVGCNRKKCERVHNLFKPSKNYFCFFDCIFILHCVFVNNTKFDALKGNQTKKKKIYEIIVPTHAYNITTLRNCTVLEAVFTSVFI